MHLSSFHLRLLLQILASSVHLYLHVLYHFMCLVSLVLSNRLIYFYIYVFNLVWNTYFSIWVIDCVTTAFASIYFNTIRIKHRFISVKIDYFGSYFTLLIILETHSKEFTFDRLENVIAVKKSTF